MARNSDIRYINLYTDGSAARQLEPKPPKKKKARLPRPRARKPLVVCIDPLALCSIAVAVVMLVLMAVGLAELNAVNTQEAQMAGYVSRLEQENAQLREDYRSGYDPETVRQEALALGMVPVEQAQHMEITVQVPQVPTQEPTVWEQICAFFGELFA